MKRRLLGIILAGLMLMQGFPAGQAAADAFSDVPPGHWAYDYILELRAQGVTDGVGGNRFGLGRTLTRAEFAAFLCRLMGWDLTAPATGSFSDNRDPSAWYFSAVETARAHGALAAGETAFRPDASITREDMAVMIVRALGYDALGQSLSTLPAPFPDVKSHTGYIMIAKDLGVIDGISPTRFAPGDTATREQAAAMLIRLLRLLAQKAAYTHGFYAIRSVGQMDAVDVLDSVGFGWSRLELRDGAVSLNTSSAGGNEYALPQGFSEPLGRAGTKLLMVAVTESDSPKIIGDPALRAVAADLLAMAALSGISDGKDSAAFDGLVIDFEALKGAEARRDFTAFLTALRKKLEGSRKLIYVAVHPARRPGLSYYDGYDFKAIGALSDRVILMAHDYYPKSLTAADMARGVTITPPAPLDEVYYAIRSICDPVTGVSDRSRVLLQISFDSVQWKTQNGKNIHSAPYHPAYDAIAQRIQNGAQMRYNAAAQSPYITFYNESDQTDNVVWYEDARSVDIKLRLADLFGLGGVSWWRLGLVPDLSEELHLNVLPRVGRESPY